MGEGGERGGGDRFEESARPAIAEIVELDLQLEDGQVRAYRARVKVSFKFETGG